MYIVLDTETGGLGKDVSLLSAYFGILDDKLELVDGLELFIKPDSGIYQIQTDALEINKINLTEHNKNAVTEKVAGQLLFKFLKHYSGDGKEKLKPIGHNVVFDIEKICEKILSKTSWNHHCTYRLRDTGTIGAYLMDIDKLPTLVSGSLGSYCSYFNVELANAHDARSDALACAEVYKKMVKLLK